MLMEMFMKEIGKRIKHMVKVYIFTLMERNIKGIGLKINKMARA